MTNEETASLGIKDNKKSTDQIILRQAIIAEYDAVSLYEQMANSTKNKKLKKVLLDIAKEERVHIGEFEAVLESIDKEHEDSVKDGKKEAKKYTSFEEWIKIKKN
jgi:rubrerythrin